MKMTPTGPEASLGKMQCRVEGGVSQQPKKRREEPGNAEMKPGVVTIFTRLIRLLSGGG